MFRSLFRSRGGSFELVGPGSRPSAGRPVTPFDAPGVLVDALSSPLDRQILRWAAQPPGSDDMLLDDDALVARLLAAITAGRLALRCIVEPPRHGGHTRPPPGPPIDPDDFDRPPADDTHWVEVVLVDAEGRGISGQRYLIVTPDGVERSGYTDSLGAARIDRLPPGDCKVAFPDLPAE